MRGFPSEVTLEFLLASDQDSRITGTARTQFAMDFAAGDALRRIDDFQDGEAAAVADIEGFAGNAVDFLESADMGIGNIEHVDVIADAGSVGSGIIRAEDIDMGQATSGGIENSGNEMCFHAMIFAALPGSSGGVEIAEAHVFEPGVELVIGKNLFENELGFSVWIDGRLRMVFRDGNNFGFAVGGGSGRENEFFHAVAGDGIEKIHAGGDVRGVEDAGLAHGFGDEGLGGKVHDGVNFVLREDGFKLSAIGEINLAKDRARRHGSPMTFEQAIQRDDGHAARRQDFRTDTADVTRCASNKNTHRYVLLESGRKPK